MTSKDVLPLSLSAQLDVLMIDNFDSFTWNLYQQLSLQGAHVTVIRNDAIHPSLLPKLRIKFLIISPGPGHPQTDSGISKAAIEYFQGKVPILGVCMGLECLVDLYGGQIACVPFFIIRFSRVGKAPTINVDYAMLISSSESSGRC
jgi:anthranilate synthase/indole-3-glycerol phosphate synthase/phosphoribosylanthranilate isomerase